MQELDKQQFQFTTMKLQEPEEDSINIEGVLNPPKLKPAEKGKVYVCRICYRAKCVPSDSRGDAIEVDEDDPRIDPSVRT